MRGDGRVTEIMETQTYISKHKMAFSIKEMSLEQNFIETKIKLTGRLTFEIIDKKMA